MVGGENLRNAYVTSLLVCLAFVFLQPTPNQMKLVLFLASCAATDPISHGLPPFFSWDPEAIQLPVPLAPDAPPPLRDKVICRHKY